jgi:hypothetical protein
LFPDGVFNKIFGKVFLTQIFGQKPVNDVFVRITAETSLHGKILLPHAAGTNKASSCVCQHSHLPRLGKRLCRLPLAGTSRRAQI